MRPAAEFNIAGAEAVIFRRLAAVPQLGDQGARHGKCRALGEHAGLRGAGVGAVSHGVDAGIVGLQGPRIDRNPTFSAMPLSTTTEGTRCLGTPRNRSNCTLRTPESTLSHRIQQLETKLGIRLLSRTARRFAIADAGEEFYRHAVVMLREAELADFPKGEQQRFVAMPSAPRTQIRLNAQS
jgi:Bacterial regulatory helix-turn-helix protein, lysR family